MRIESGVFAYVFGPFSTNVYKWLFVKDLFVLCLETFYPEFVTVFNVLKRPTLGQSTVHAFKPVCGVFVCAI